MSTFVRTVDFERSEPQEGLLSEVNRLLARADDDAVQGPPASPAMPLVFIVGAPRSGTTLMLQWLASSGEFAYPTNLLSRFYAAPYVGARIQQLLTDASLDFRGELDELHQASLDWSSDVGKTSGVLQPHEFSYFWRRFFPIDQAQPLTPEALAAADPEGFVDGWARIERAFGKPIAAKGILLQYDIDRLAAWLPGSVFIHTRREPFYNIQSLLGARERVFGTREAWFSVRPPQYEWLQQEDIYTQVAGQVLYTNRAIERQLLALASHRYIEVVYEEFCQDPGTVWNRLRYNLAQLDHRLPPYAGPDHFQSTNSLRCSSDDAARIRAAYERVENLSS